MENVEENDALSSSSGSASSPESIEECILPVSHIVELLRSEMDSISYRSRNYDSGRQIEEEEWQTSQPFREDLWEGFRYGHNLTA